MRNDILEQKEEILRLISNQEPKSLICRKFKCKPETLNRYLKIMGVSYDGNMGLRGKKSDPKRKSAFEYLEKDIVVTSKLRRKLIEDGVKKEECEECGVTEWMGKKIILELHHVDGDRCNNNLNNLRVLCPNCHSLTPNHSRKK